MGHGDACPHTGGALGLPLAQGVEHLGGIQPEGAGGEICGDGQRVTLAVGVRTLGNSALVEPGADVHGVTLISVTRAGRGADHRIAEILQALPCADHGIVPVLRVS